MPGVPAPVGIGPSGMPPFLNAMLQATQGTQAAVNGLAGGAPAGWVVDQNGNVEELSGANLNQIVTIGAAHLQAGVLVSTGIASGTAGRAVQSGPATTTITLTKGSTSATVGTVTGAVLAQGQVIGAALVNDPTTGTPTSAITPGTTIAALSGSTVTLSQGAAESGTGLYCAAARFILQQDTGAVSLVGAVATNVTASTPATGGYTLAVRLQGDIVRFKGNIQVSAGFTAGQTLLTIPSMFYPAENLDVSVSGLLGSTPVAFPLQVLTSGIVSAPVALSSGTILFLDGLTYTLS